MFSQKHRVLLKRAKAALVFEKYLAAFWPVIFVIAAYIGIYLSLLNHIGSTTLIYTTYGLSFGFIVFFIYRGHQALRQNHISQSQIARRVEKDNSLKHRPLETLQDTPYGEATPSANTLWAAYLSKQKKIVTSLHASLPSVNLIKFDTYALRIGALILFCLGLLISGKNLPQDLQKAVLPFANAEKDVDGQSRFQFTILPPQYTGLRKQVLTDKALERPLIIPAGSELNIRVFGGFGTPVLLMDAQKFALSKTEDQTFLLKATVAECSKIKIRQGLMTLAAYDVEYLQDHKPEISWDGTIEELPLAQSGLTFDVFDDYGTKETIFELSLNEAAGQGPYFAAEAQIKRSVITGPKSRLQITQNYDLSAHLWSGLPVDVTLSVIDHANQKTTITQEGLMLPVRTFNHPIAKDIIDMRTDIAWSTTAALPQIQERLKPYIEDKPLSIEDQNAYLVLSAAYYRIQNDVSMETAEELVKLFWDVAVLLEDGGLTESRENLAQAIQELLETLNNSDSNADELAEKYDEFQSALNEYLNKLNDALQKKLQNQALQDIPPESLDQLTQPKDLDEFMQELLEDLAKGDKESAFDKLSRLEDFLDNLSPSLKAPIPMQMEFNAQSVNELQLLIEEQQKLLDQTKSQSMSEKNGSAPITAPNAIEQNALRLVLGEIIRKAGIILDEIPENLSEAEQAMRRAIKTLKENAPTATVPHQEYALKKLKEAQKDMTQQMQQQMAQMYIMGQGPQKKLDPLGREYSEGGANSQMGDGDVTIPDERTKRRIEEIIKELRERSSEFNRPREELDYLKRLLERF